MQADGKVRVTEDTAERFKTVDLETRKMCIRDRLYAARAARLAFIVNVVINSRKEVVYAAAGDCELAHVQGREFRCV